ncbi:MAG TPA: YcxB family protein [Anaerolineales bacterium]
MEIKFDRTIDNLLDFNLYHMAHSPGERRQWLGARVITTMLTTLFAVILSMWGTTSLQPLYLVPAALAGLVVFLIFPAVARWSASGRIRRILKEGDNDSIFGPQTISFSAEGIFAKNRSGESRFNWSAVKKFSENDRHFFLYTSSYQALVIPKRCFESGEEIQAFRELIDRFRQKV